MKGGKKIITVKACIADTPIIRTTARPPEKKNELQKFEPSTAPLLRVHATSKDGNTLSRGYPEGVQRVSTVSGVAS